MCEPPHATDGPRVHGLFASEESRGCSATLSPIVRHKEITLSHNRARRPAETSDEPRKRCRYGVVGLRLSGATGATGWCSSALELPGPLEAALQAGVAREPVEVQLRTDVAAAERPWVVLGGPCLRMHSQPTRGLRRGQRRQKLKNLCWVPPVATVVEHYTGQSLTCDEVLRTLGKDDGRDEAEDPLEMLSDHWGIECGSAYVESLEEHSGGRPRGWDEEGTRPLYEQAGGGCERVSAEWWACMAAALAAGHPTFVLGERVEAANVRLAKKHGDSYCHCMLVVGFEGALGAPQSSDRRSASTRGDQTPPRLLVKDPCNAERLLEATFAANLGSGAVQLRVHHRGGCSLVDRYRVKGSVHFTGVRP